ncbi:MAG: sodium-dependent transporter [Planctomycetes bacterium]|nr:sodium-dependent transporter [Planctomycetota bacterium]
MAQLLEEQRESWGTRAGFVLAAIGSAVGLGNLWGFPYKLYDHGGGAFLIPYIVGMLLIGVPVLILEFSLGHMTQRAAPDAFRGVNRRSEPIGWWGILLGFVIVTYYAVLLAYCLSFLVVSVQGLFNGGQLPWAAHGAEGVETAENYFHTTYLQRLQDAPPGTLGGLVPNVVWSLIATWVLIYLCIFRGVRLVSKVVMWTVPLPWLMLLILVIRGLTLDGAETGLEYYLRPVWSELAKPDTWTYAFGQVFFSMSLAFGVMVTYASFLHRKSDLNNNAAIIGLADLGTSFIAGIAVFATLGAMAMATGQPVKDVLDGGPGLTFVVFPYALAQFPHPALFSTIFFFALITLGIDSAFSIAESVLASVVDKLRCNRDVALIVMVLVCLGIGLVYCTQGGMGWWGAMDDFINGPWGIALLGLLQCVVLGWMYRISRLRRHANERSDWRLGPWWDWLVRVVVPVMLAALFIWNVLEQSTSARFLRNEHGLPVWPNIVGLILAATAPLLAVVLSLIPSPGADAHDAHAGHPAGRRTGGRIGLVLGAAAVGAICIGFAFTRTAQLDYRGQGQPDLGGAAMILFGALALSLGGLALGTAGVVGAEANHLRPSTAARGAASLSVLTTGVSIGLLLPLLIMAAQLDREIEVVHQNTLSAWSLCILAATLLLVFGGLLVCFYLALKAAGGEEAVQVAEDMRNTGD